MCPITGGCIYNLILDFDMVSDHKQKCAYSDFFRILSTSTDRNAVELVSTMEGIKYPFYSTQWHQEKNPFEWTLKENIPQHDIAIKLTQYMSNFFVNEARQTKHKFLTPGEAASFIYNYSPAYTGNITCFQKCYII